MITFEYLDEERKKLWEKILQLEEEILKKTPDYEREAKSDSKKASEYRNRCEDAKNTAESLLSEIKSKLVLIDNLFAEVNENLNFSTDNSNKISVLLSDANTNYNKLIEKKTLIDNYLEVLELAFKNHPELDSEIEVLNSALNQSDELFTKISAIYKNAVARKKEIDSLYIDIVGHKETDENTGEEIEIEGLKDKLEGVYNDLSINFKKLQNEFVELKEKSKKDYEDFIQIKNTIFLEKLDLWTTNFEIILEKITNLLPNALTAGLSYAYSDKKFAEEKEQKKLAKRFNIGIIGLILVSLIPFGISIESIIEGIELEEAILRMPRLVLAIIPLYIPVMWVAYSANRKMNLSKRLIEEYSHKEALSKTFEGLSKQINDISDQSISSDLKLKLLYNILEVSSENPGKLISDYNKSDHPLMDALDKSVKLANAVDKLSNIPGLSKLSKVLENKSKRIIDNEAKKVGEILDDFEDSGNN